MRLMFTRGQRARALLDDSVENATGHTFADKADIYGEGARMALARARRGGLGGHNSYMLVAEKLFDLEGTAHAAAAYVADHPSLSTNHTDKAEESFAFMRGAGVLAESVRPYPGDEHDMEKVLHLMSLLQKRK